MSAWNNHKRQERKESIWKIYVLQSGVCRFRIGTSFEFDTRGQIHCWRSWNFFFVSLFRRALCPRIHRRFLCKKPTTRILVNIACGFTFTHSVRLSIVVSCVTILTDRKLRLSLNCSTIEGLSVWQRKEVQDDLEFLRFSSQDSSI